MNYESFVKTKSYISQTSGFDPESVNVNLFDFQRDVVKWACRRGKAAIFADTGLGKTAMQLSWADEVVKHTGKRVLLLAPLCVAQQTVSEGRKFGIDSVYIRGPVETKEYIHVTNYEMLKNFRPEDYAGIVLDESSILKGLQGKVRKHITEFALNIPYRLSCTATPSPNDFMELGTQSEFLGIMSQVEMLATFFIHDGSDTSKWRLKGHGRKKFFEWLGTWAAVIRKPSDLGYKAVGYDLPPLILHEHIIETAPIDGLFADIALGLQERNAARRESIQERCEKASEILDEFDIGIAWCNLNSESELIANRPDVVEITGSMDQDKKEKSIMGFTNQEISKIVTKPKIAGFGLNWQHCNKMVFIGLSDSFESYYQAIRRCWRFGQTEPVNVHIVISDREGAVLENIKRKQRDHDRLSQEMSDIMSDITKQEIKGATVEKADYLPSDEIIIPNFMKVRA